VPINLKDPIFDLARRLELNRTAVSEVRRKRADAVRAGARRELEQQLADAERAVTAAEAAHEYRRLPPGARPNREVEIARERHRRLRDDDGPAKLRLADEAAGAIADAQHDRPATITPEDGPPEGPTRGGRWG
jgi:multidrug efflux pump subunit AcrA (membrane-fusion protein)